VDVGRMVEALKFRKEPAVMESFRTTLVTLHNASAKPDSLYGLPQSGPASTHLMRVFDSQDGKSQRMAT
jgi:hypothetical protein